MAACYEQEINFIGKYIRYYISQHETREDKLEELYKYLNLVNPVQLEWTKEYITTLTDDEVDEYLQEIVDTGIPVIQPPFYGNIDLNGLTKIYDTYPDIQEFKFKGIKNPMIMGEMFLMTLKHDTKGKLSVRSTGFNNMSDLPAKSKAKKDYKIPYSNTPIRLNV